MLLLRKSRWRKNRKCARPKKGAPSSLFIRLASSARGGNLVFLENRTVLLSRYGRLATPFLLGRLFNQEP
jgi:hypothetical protein